MKSINNMTNLDKEDPSSLLITHFIDFFHQIKKPKGLVETFNERKKISSRTIKKHPLCRKILGI